MAAASGISAQIIVQPFSAPSPETITRIAITSPAHEPPKISLAAVENGSFVDWSCVLERIPKIAISESM